MKRTLLACVLLVALLIAPASGHRETTKLSALVPGLDVVTTFAHDYGERLYKVNFEGEEYAPGEATEKILPLIDWKTRPDKLELAVAWVKVFALHGGQVIEEGDERLSGPEEAPRAEFLADGTFRYTAWVVTMSGRNPGTLVFKKQVEISPDAVMTVVDLHTPLDRSSLPTH